MVGPAATSPCGDTATPPRRLGPFTLLACAWMIGVLAARHVPLSGGFWLLLAAVPLLFALAQRWRGKMRAAACWALLAAAPVAAGWSAVRLYAVSEFDIGHFIGQSSQLAQVTGVVAGPPYLTPAQRGAFAMFSYRPPGTLFTLDVDGLVVGARPQRSAGRILVKVEQAEHRIREGDRVRLVGWLGPLDGPANPGEFDYRAYLADRGMVGRLTVPTRGNCTPLEPPRFSSLTRLRRAMADAAAGSLRLGMDQEPQRRAMLEAMLLGIRTTDAVEMRDSFRRVGLSHLLSISGAHLGILLWVVWLLAKLAVHHPRRAAWLVLAILLLYLTVLPPRVPVIRAGIMAGIICLGLIAGRRTEVIELLALACVAVLIWRPSELFSAGFQLSFGAVAALVLFTDRVSRMIWPEPLLLAPGWRHPWPRRAADYLAVNTIAFIITMPLVACHFQVITPLAILLSLLALPVVTGVLALGYAKMFIGLLLPSMGLLLAGPLAWLCDAMYTLVQHATTWPASTMELPRAPGLAWTVAASFTGVAWLDGLFVRRRTALLAAMTLGVSWLAIVTMPPASRPLLGRLTRQPVMSLTMFGVGNGSCFLLQVRDRHAGKTWNLMFDCGSQEYGDVGIQSLTPALRHLGVRRLDALLISHADLDHYNGVLDLMDRVPVACVLVAPQMQAAAHTRPTSATAHLLRGVRQRGVPVTVVSQGWSATVDEAELRILWPPAERTARRANDVSLVLAVTAADRRVLLNGDIEQEAITALLDSGVDLRADVCDLPHHGSFVPASPRWIAAVQPDIVLQSSGNARMRQDRWAAVLPPNVRRLVSEVHGMTQVHIAGDGAVHVTTFR